ncbi:MAG: replication-associated recombination protein A [Clostridiales bacterium]|nr:replication-associated recombination protein A [Clostridiales bacterium]
MENKARVPLAEKMRPKSFDDFVGQGHIVGENSLLYRAIKYGTLGSCIFYGPPGTGKTTLANIIASSLKANYVKLNAVTSGVTDAKAIIERAKTDKALLGIDTFLILDECHRWNKAQSDCVLEAIEDGSIFFIGTTTENPYTSMTRAIVSRCRVFEFKPLTTQDIVSALVRAINDNEKGLGNFPIEYEQQALEYIAYASGGDLRNSLNSLELAVMTSPIEKDKKIHIDLQTAQQSTDKKALSLDENMYYDFLSAFCKSLRGSDVEGALYYSQRLINAGCDAMVIARRLVAHASEDVGMADSNALLLATSAMYAVEKMGVPEGLIPLTHAIIYVCEAEKSNSVIQALQLARDDALNNTDNKVPNHLKNHPSTNGDGHGTYKYPHNYGGYVKQQYMPDSLKDRVYYVPSQNGREKNIIRKKFKGEK